MTPSTRPVERAATPWGAVVAAALVGTARRPPPAAADLGFGSIFGDGAGGSPDLGFGSIFGDGTGGSPDLGNGPSGGAGLDLGNGPSGGAGLDLGVEIEVGDPAGRLLAAAAVLSICGRAGRLPDEAPRRSPAPAGPDDRPACSETAVEVLELVLSGEVPIPGGVALLSGQWLDGAARAGCRPPARLLPRLLDLGWAASDLRPTLRDVIGPRGRWLAGHHDPWGWAAGAAVDGGEPAERRFATAPRADRPALLEAVRRAAPTRGLDLLASTWKSDPAAERAAFLAVLAVCLSDDDEPFLEAALGDRSMAVRQVAADLLGRLPASRRAARMADRLRPLITPAGRQSDRAPAGAGGRRRPWSVARPAEPDAASRRDGITDAAPAGMGVSAWRLAQIVAGAPLSFWGEHLGLNPAEIVELAAEGAPEVLAGLERAVAAQAGRADPAWAVAVFAHRPTPAVLAALPPGRAARELARLLAGGLAPRPTVAELYAACPGPWPAPLGEAVLDRYRQLGAKAALEMPAALPVLAARLDPSALPLVETWVVTLAGDQALRRRVQTLGHALSLRAVIQREFP